MPEQVSLFKTPEGEVQYMATYEETFTFWPVPAESMTVPTRYGTTYVVASGPKTGKPLVLLHGMNGSATMWAGTINKFANSYRTYAVDVIGEPNKSTPSRPMLTRNEAVEWLSDVLDQLDITSCYLAGMSKGAWLAMNLSLALPARIKRLVLFAPTGVFANFSFSFWLKSIKMLLFPRESVWGNFFNWHCVKPFLVTELQRKLSHQMFVGMKQLRFQKSIIPCVFPDEDFKGYQVPTLVLFGEKEVLYNSKAALKRASTLGSNLKLRMIPDAGHAMLFDQPELVCNLALDFLAE